MSRTATTLTFTAADFDFHLPDALIAQAPLPERSASRLLHLEPTGTVHHHAVRALPELLRSGDLLVFNDTRVVPARVFGHKASGGRVELLVERWNLDPGAPQLSARIRASRSPKPGQRLVLPLAEAEVRGREEESFLLALHPETAGQNALDWLEAVGELPLPPYITRAPDSHDAERYQTVWAREPGAIAAPTAGLHFDSALLDALDAQGIARTTLTLHVGAGTFQPVRVQSLDQHVMHAEQVNVPLDCVEAVHATRSRGGRIIAVGTTSVRALEGVAATGDLRPWRGETRLFLKPGDRFRVIDGLFTNFHLPRSTLLMLVSALAGIEAVRHAYAEAVREHYRFFSYGDAMLCWNQESTR